MYKEFSKAWWQEDAVKWVVYLMVGMHILALGAFVPQLFSWSGVGWFLLLHWLSGGLGITLGYHRLLAHNSFKTSPVVRFVLTWCACLAWQGSPLVWVGTHLHHHKHSDDELDPHSPQHGFSWSHLIWVLSKSPEGFVATNCAKSLARDPMMRWFHRFWWVPQVTTTLVLIVSGWIIGGWLLALSWLVWGIGLRTVVVYHSTWLVNSATHKWGYQNFTNTGDNSRNLWWVALLSYGEGWHNNHHGCARSAAHGMRWYEIDVTYYTILVLSWLRLVWDVQKPPAVP